MKTIILAASALALSMGAAMAGEGNYEPFPNTAAGRFAVPAQAFNDTGSAGYIRTQRPVAALANDEALPQSGSEASVQTANSLPLGAEEGTVAYAQARSVQRWMLAHQGTPFRVASR